MPLLLVLVVMICYKRPFFSPKGPSAALYLEELLLSWIERKMPFFSHCHYYYYM